jgi:hypothetical protein
LEAAALVGTPCHFQHNHVSRIESQSRLHKNVSSCRTAPRGGRVSIYTQLFACSLEPWIRSLATKSAARALLVTLIVYFFAFQYCKDRLWRKPHSASSIATMSRILPIPTIARRRRRALFKLRITRSIVKAVSLEATTLSCALRMRRSSALSCNALRAR